MTKLKDLKKKGTPLKEAQLPGKLRETLESMDIWTCEAAFGYLFKYSEENKKIIRDGIGSWCTGYDEVMKKIALAIPHETLAKFIGLSYLEYMYGEE